MPELPIGAPSPEEATLIALRDGAYEAAATSMLAGIEVGKSPSMLAIARPDILLATSEELWPAAAAAPRTRGPGYKGREFDRYAQAASEGDPAAASMLPKLATTLGELATTIEITHDNRETIAEWREGRTYTQFIGSFNPMHIGHRATIAATLEVAGERSNALVQVVKDHPIKKDSLPPYGTRFVPGEEKLYSSNLIDPTRVTMLDVPLGLGLAKVGFEQIKLIADVTGDSEMRWQVGSDKFMSDVRSVQAGKSLDKAGARFAAVHLYVARRDTESPEELLHGIEYVQNRYGAAVTLVPETTSQLVLDAAASKIRAMRAAGDHQQAEIMEFSDITKL